jgi:hypothetical protein
MKRSGARVRPAKIRVGGKRDQRLGVGLWMRVAAILGSPILILFHTAPHILANQPTQILRLPAAAGSEDKSGDHLAFWNQSDVDCETSHP